MQNLALVVTGAIIFVSLPTVKGHGYLVEPAAQWPEGYPVNGYSATVDNEIWGVYDNAKYGYGANGTLSFFIDVFPSKGYKSLGDFITKNQELYSDKMSPDCGLTTFKDTARSKLPAQLTYSGFTHPGPCEVRCDDTIVLSENDCQTKFSAIPAIMSYDKAKCANANRMTIYWLALHGDPWQVYTNCAWLEGGSGRGEAPLKVSSGGSTPTTTTTPGTSSASPSPASRTSPASQEVGKEAIVSTGDSYGPSTPDSTPTSTPPTTTTPPTSSDATPPTPSSSAPPSTSSETTGAKCVRRN
ncbi:uncharacterized protein PHALS_02295 [Plasmopara halstedii]|uniref:RxLR-like protein n=1 Tax=Plasmopara halstedii TaxID=4781 RepID=A0A0N7L734_PLAHL|nr:uncharacterized protein PHALS_02295 [Plasmopara halstedii]CEG45963.1 hypothetical protein PHALS_02295 [Plasmopara halstedii]|eukprot:XP_024582332.1 hypothetical protein PHALS_02295 [Plasmopara halstedii]